MGSDHVHSTHLAFSDGIPVCSSRGELKTSQDIGEVNCAGCLIKVANKTKYGHQMRFDARNRMHELGLTGKLRRSGWDKLTRLSFARVPEPPKEKEEKP